MASLRLPFWMSCSPWFTRFAACWEFCCVWAFVLRGTNVVSPQRKSRGSQWLFGFGWDLISFKRKF